MNLTNEMNAAQKLRQAATRRDKERGMFIAYHEGDFSTNVNTTKVGATAYELAQSGLVRLFQKKLSDEPRLYQYLAQVV